MREPSGSFLQGAASALIFAAFAVLAGAVVGWPASDILSAGIVAGCGGAALDYFLRRHYGMAGAFIVLALGLTAYTLRPDVDAGATIRGAATDEGESGGAFPGPRSASAQGRERKHDNRHETGDQGSARPLATGSPADTIPTTLEVHNPASVPVSVSYEYPGGSIALGAVAAGGTATFAIPLPGPLELGTIIGRAGDRSVRTHVWLRPRRAHQVELPSID